jgi:hypothetical protein
MLQVSGGTQKEFHINTDPYRPPVGATPSDDVPLIVKSTEELPAGSMGLRYVRHSESGRRRQGDSHIEATHGVPKFYKCP